MLVAVEVVKVTDQGCIWKAKLTEFADGLSIGCEAKMGIEDDTWAFDLRNCVYDKAT